MIKNTFYTILILSLLIPFSVFSEELQEEKALIEAKRAQVMIDLCLNEAVATDYLKNVFVATKARIAAQKNGDEVSVLYADALEQLTFALLFGETNILKGKNILNELSAEKPGTPTPQILTNKINTWSLLTTSSLLEIQKANTLVNQWSVKNFTTSPYCQANNHLNNHEKCAKLASQPLDVFEKMIDQSKHLSASLEVLKLSVSKLRY